MAASYLSTYGIDLQAEMDTVYHSSLPNNHPPSPSIEPPIRTVPVSKIDAVLLSTSSSDLFDICISPASTSARISSITPSSSSSNQPRLALPALCHPHIHIDKAHLLSQPSTSHLCAPNTFTDALSLTRSAKRTYDATTLRQRMEWTLFESLRAGVTSMRAFVEVDAMVRTTPLDVLKALKREWESVLDVQICAFAQEGVFTCTTSTSSPSTASDETNEDDNRDEDGSSTRRLFESIASDAHVGALGSTPYVESDPDKAKRNIRWLVDLAVKYGKHIDFHLDYTLEDTEPLVWCVLSHLKTVNWEKTGKTVCLGHCTRLTQFSAAELDRLASEARGLNVSFVGLPSSDLFMMGRTQSKSPSADGPGSGSRSEMSTPRGTLNPLSLLSRDVNVALGVNNLGNAFTPFGSADPLDLAKWGVGLYHAGGEGEVEGLYGCVSWRARRAIGLEVRGSGVDGDGGGSDENGKEGGVKRVEDWRKTSTSELRLKAGDADFIVFKAPTGRFARRKRSVREVVADPPQFVEREVFVRGRRVVFD